MDRTKKRILFAGAYGIENAGDDLPLIVLSQRIKKILPSIEFRALSRHPNVWEENKYGVKMIKNLEYESREDAKGKWFKGLNFGDDKEDIARVTKEIKNCNLIVIGAGNFLIDITIDIFRGPVPLIALYVFLAKMFHKPVMLFGFSAGPLKTQIGINLSRWIIESADIVTVRDMASQQFVENLLYLPKKIHQLPDPTLGVESLSQICIEKNIIKEKINTKRKIIAIGLRDLSSLFSHKVTQEFLKQLAKYINLMKRQYSFLFIPQSTYKEDDDRLIAKKIVSLLDNDVEYTIIENRYDPMELIGFYSICELTIAVRLHSAVFSIIARTPVIAINYLPKVEGFMRSMGVERNLLKVNRCKMKDLLRITEQIMANKKSIVKDISKRLRRKKQLVNRYAEFAISLLEREG